MLFSTLRLGQRTGYNALFKRTYKLSANAVRKGQIVQIDDKPYKVLNRESSAQGRGGAVIKVDLENILNKTKRELRYKSGDSVEILNAEDEGYQYLYSEEDQIHLFHPETLDQIEMNIQQCQGGQNVAAMLQDGMPINVTFLTAAEAGRQPILFKLPQTYTFEVSSVHERGGQSAKGTVFKTATLSNGAKLQVPEFVKIGDKIVVDLESMKYVKREL